MYLLQIKQAIKEELDGPGPTKGGRAMHAALRHSGLMIARKRVYQMMRELDPQGNNKLFFHPIFNCL